MPDQITLVTEDRTGPAVPQSFVRSLREYDRSLLVSWNHRKMRFVIEQCTGHHAPTPTHNHLCSRIYVLLVQDTDGCMMSLGDAVMDMIRKRDVTKAGYGPNDLQRWTADRAAEDEENRAKIEAAQDDAVHHLTKFNRRQVLRAFNALNNMGTPNR